MSLQSSIERVRSLGAAKEGVSHWWMQRVTAIAITPLTLWFLISLIGVVSADYETVVAWIGSPINTVLLVALLAGVFYHAMLGMQVVIEDYIHVEGVRVMSLLVMKFALLLLGGAAILAVLRIAFGG